MTTKDFIKLFLPPVVLKIRKRILSKIKYICTSDATQNVDEFSIHKIYSTKEIFIQQNRNFFQLTNYDRYKFTGGGYNRLDTIVRYLAVENYYNKNNCGFDLYKKMQAARCGKDYVTESVERFVNLIKSFEKEYDTSSEISLDCDLDLVDGSHRLALCLYHNINEISCKISEKKHGVTYGVDWFLKNDFSEKEVSVILEKCENVFEYLYNENVLSISLILWPPVWQFFDEITEKLSLVYDIKNVRDMELQDRIFERVIKGVYHIDDIDDWKIDKKLEYMQQYEKKIRFADIYFGCPNFRRKASNNNTLSVAGEKIKEIVRSCYKGKIDNYFYDIICLTGDNFSQSEYIRQLFLCDIKLDKYFEKIKDLEYMLIKYDVPYIPDDFPKSYPFSKDCDMIVSEKHYNDICSITYEFFSQNIKSPYEIRIIESDYGNYRLRIELKGFLIYQIDISCKIESLSNDFIVSSLSNRKLHKNMYYVSDEKDEVYYRMIEYKKNPTKIHHLEWVEMHKYLYDENVLEKILKEK